MVEMVTVTAAAPGKERPPDPAGAEEQAWGRGSLSPDRDLSPRLASCALFQENKDSEPQETGGIVVLFSHLDHVKENVRSLPPLRSGRSP